MQSTPGRSLTTCSHGGGPGAGSTPPPPSRPHLLALHGWRTSASVLTKQLQRSGLGELLDQVAEVTCLDAPHPARGPPTPDVRRAFQPPFHEWWDAVQDDASGAVRYVGAEESLGLLAGELRAAAAAGRPVSGLVGFSQGAALAGLVVALQERGERFQDVPPLHCALLVAGGVVRDTSYSRLYDCDGSGDAAAAAATTTSPAARGLTSSPSEAAAAAPASAAPASTAAAAVASAPLCLPSCHLVGSADPLRGNAEKLIAAFRQPLVLRHDQGHVVPRLDEEQGQQLTNWLRHHLVKQPRS